LDAANHQVLDALERAAETVEDGRDVDDEIRHLMQALRA
jgi:hypothetical protein